MALTARLFSGQVSDIDLKLLRTFRAVADCSGFSMAEIELGLTKSAISKQIADLETRLGVKLCHRGRSGFALTPEGQVVYKASTRMFGALEGFRSELNALRNRPVGTLNIGCIDTLITSRRSPLIKILAEFSTEFPEIELKIVTASSAEIDRHVADQGLQIGISTDRGKIMDAHALPLFQEYGYLYCGAAHPLFSVEESDVTLDVVNVHRFAQHAYSEAEIRDEQRIGFNPAATGQFTDGIAMLILTGNFIGFLPEHYARNWVQTGQMRALLPTNIRKVTNIRLLYRAEASKNPLISAFVKTAKDMKDASTQNSSV